MIVDKSFSNMCLGVAGGGGEQENATALIAASVVAYGDADFFST